MDAPDLPSYPLSTASFDRLSLESLDISIIYQTQLARLPIKYFIPPRCPAQPAILDYGALDLAKSAYRINDTHRLFGGVF